MQLGLTPWSISDSNDAQALCDQAMYAEELGYSYFVLPEHHFVPSRAIPDPLMLLAAVAANTTSIRLATTSYLLPIRHPVQAAEQVAVLDQLCNGRLTLGVGRGTLPAMFETFGVDPRTKRKRFEYCLERMRKAWTGESVVEGSTELQASISPLPRQVPHPPIWVAAFGPMALKQAGRLGLPYLASPRETMSQLAHNYRIHRAANEEATVAMAAETPIMRSVFVSEDPETVRRVRDRIEQSLQRPPQSQDDSERGVDDWAIVGTPNQVRDLTTTYMEDLGISHLIATRLGIGGVSSSEIKQSLALFMRIVNEMSG